MTESVNICIVERVDKGYLYSKANNSTNSKAYVGVFPGSFQKLAECLQGRIQCGAGEEEFEQVSKNQPTALWEAGIGGGWADWSQLGHLAKPGAWGPGHSQPPQSHPTPLLREPPSGSQLGKLLTCRRKEM